MRVNSSVPYHSPPLPLVLLQKVYCICLFLLACHVFRLDTFIHEIHFYSTIFSTKQDQAEVNFGPSMPNLKQIPAVKQLVSI